MNALGNNSIRGDWRRGLDQAGLGMLALVILCTLLSGCEWGDEADEASCNDLVHGPGTPSIHFTYVPPYGSFEDLLGGVHHVAPAQHDVAVYIRVFGGWWTKSYWATPLTAIDCDGSWTCDITTGGIDELADQIAAFLLPDGVEPPLMSGGGALPDELFRTSVAHLIVDRPQTLSATQAWMSALMPWNPIGMSRWGL